MCIPVAGSFPEPVPGPLPALALAGGHGNLGHSLDTPEELHHLPGRSQSSASDVALGHRRDDARPIPEASLLKLSCRVRQELSRASVFQGRLVTAHSGWEGHQMPAGPRGSAEELSPVGCWPLSTPARPRLPGGLASPTTLLLGACLEHRPVHKGFPTALAENQGFLFFYFFLSKTGSRCGSWPGPELGPELLEAMKSSHTPAQSGCPGPPSRTSALCLVLALGCHTAFCLPKSHG